MRRPTALLVLAAAVLTVPRSPAQRFYTGEAEIRQGLGSLNTLGSALIIGAHPDDENEAQVAYLALGRHVRTAYLSLTRGEGGQNLIGPEQGVELGIIRSQELLSSRRISGGEQYFTRAVDFGFSKSSAEALSKWPRDKVLGDVVWNIRRFRPDVILSRWTGTPRDGHGHHQAAGILAKEAFALAGDASKYPEQLAWVEPWQPKRLMMRGESDSPDRIEVELGAYVPELGYSWGEIRGLARSMNRSQGDGVGQSRGSQKDILITVAGDKAAADMFDGVNLSWSRLPGGAAVGAMLKQALENYTPAHPEALLDPLLRARPLIAAIQDPLARHKLKELDDMLALCAGLWLDAQADRPAVNPGTDLRVNVTALVRTPAQVTLTGLRLTGMEGAPVINVASQVLAHNQPSRYSATLRIPENQPYSQPYWLEQPSDGVFYNVRDSRMAGLAENPPVLEARFQLRMGGTDVEMVRPVHYRFNNPVYGEQIRPLTVAPPVALDLSEKSQVFPDNRPRKVEVPVRSNIGKVAGDVRLEVPPGWKAEPASRHFELANRDEQATLSFELTPPPGEARGRLRAVADVGGRAVSSGTEVIQYTHIATQTLFPPAEIPLVRTDVRTLAHRIGYVMGSGDEVPGALKMLGCEVTLLSAEDLARGDLSRFDAIVTGARAFQTRFDLRSAYPRLLEYASNGGTLVVQYNQVPPGGGGLPVPVGPYPLRIGRDRVTVEEAPVVFPNPQLPLLNAPNRITAADFEGWVQERGLYFADQWDPRYQSVLESHDPGEEPHPGGMLYARVGKGAYIYTAYAWFRQLPAGVPGAYRVFANLLSAAKTQ